MVGRQPVGRLGVPRRHPDLAAQSGLLGPEPDRHRRYRHGLGALAPMVGQQPVGRLGVPSAVPAWTSATRSPGPLTNWTCSWSGPTARSGTSGTGRPITREVLEVSDATTGLSPDEQDKIA